MDALPDLRSLQDIVRKVARQNLMSVAPVAAAFQKADGSVVTAADLSTQKVLMAELAQRWPEYGFLGEEMSQAEQQRLFDQGGGVWCLDPLDGTSNFAAGLPFFSISLALLIDRDIRLGVVYDPERDECFSAVKGRGAALNGRPIRCRAAPIPLSHCIAVVDFKRLPTELAVRLASGPPYRSQRSFGSVALDWCWLAANRYDIYLHGKQSLWDYAAGCLVLAEAGGHAQSLDGRPVYQFDLVPRSAVAAADERVLAAWAAWLAQ